MRTAHFSGTRAHHRKETSSRKRRPGLCSKSPKTGGRLRYYVFTLFNEPLPTQFPRLPEHKNLDFVLEKPENEGFEAQKSTKMPILCSKCPKMRVSEGKSAQKTRLCARKPRKRGFQRVKAHKNVNFVLGKPENEGLEGQKRTKTPILCSGKRELAPGREKISIRKRKVAFLQITCTPDQAAAIQ